MVDARESQDIGDAHAKFPRSSAGARKLPARQLLLRRRTGCLKVSCLHLAGSLVLSSFHLWRWHLWRWHRAQNSPKPLPLSTIASPEPHATCINPQPPNAEPKRRTLGRPTIDGKTARGDSPPAKPAYARDPRGACRILINVSGKHPHTHTDTFMLIACVWQNTSYIERCSNVGLLGPKASGFWGLGFLSSPRWWEGFHCLGLELLL